MSQITGLKGNVQRFYNCVKMGYDPILPKFPKSILFTYGWWVVPMGVGQFLPPRHYPPPGHFPLDVPLH